MSECGSYDYNRAVEWLQPAATQGHQEAMYRIASMYFHGTGISKDVARGEELFRTAAGKGHTLAARTLGDIYFWGLENVPKDLDEAEIWYWLAAEHGDVISQSRLDRTIEQINHPGERERKKQEQIALENGLESRKQREIEQWQNEAQKYAQKAEAQFQSIHLSIVESEISKQLRFEIRDKLKTMPEPKEPTKAKDASGLFDLILVPIEMGPYLPLGIFIGDGSGPLPSEEEWADIKNASIQLSSLLMGENVESSLQTQLLDVANKQQAFGLLKTSHSDVPHAVPQLRIQVEEIGFFKLPGDYGRARLWLAATAMLVDANQQSIHKRFCYATDQPEPLSPWTGTERFRQELTLAYRNVSNQILVDLVGLAPDPDANQSWSKTALACLTDNQNPRTSERSSIGQVPVWDRE